MRLIGFVASTSGRQFELARFYITCCVADAVPVGVPVDTGGARYSKDEWLDVSATLSQRGKHYVLEARQIRHVKAPKDPYLAFSS